MTAERLMFLSGVLAFLFTVLRVRGRALREKYGILWLAIGFLLLLSGLFPRLIMGFAEAAHLSYSSAVLFVALALIYVFAFTVSESLTGLYRQYVRLMQEVAILEERLRNVEARSEETASWPAPEIQHARR
jgi:hypothetical protein